MKKLLLVIGIVYSGLSLAQPKLLYSNKAFFDAIYNVDSLAVDKINKSSISNEYKPLLCAYSLFWEGIDKDQSSCIRKADNQLTYYDKNKVDNEYLMVSIKLLQMRIDLMRNHYFSALSNSRYIKQHLKTPVDYSEPFDVFLKGLYYYLSDYIGSSGLIYKMLLPSWAEEDANREFGLELLIKCQQSESVLVSTEAYYFLGRIYLEYEEKPELAKECFDYLNQRFPNNRIYKEFSSLCDTASVCE